MVAGPLRRNGTSIRLDNFDAWGYAAASRKLYQSHPWVLGVRRDGSAFGMLFETTRRATISLRRSVTCIAMGPAPAVVVIERAHPMEVVEALATLTGCAPMPPRWALGYHQCRYSYMTAERVLEVGREFRARRIPCDGLWMDIDHMSGFRCFTFDHERFPDPRGLHHALHEMGFHAVTMVDPGIKVDHRYGVYRSGRAGGHFLRTPHEPPGEVHVRVWPGQCALPDFLNSRVREWWSEQCRELTSVGADGVWNDMNEPAAFDAGPRKTISDDIPHRADADLGGPGDHGRYHNVYGMQMARATSEGLARLRPNRRVFVLTRANFLGGQRYAACWTGDNTSNWSHLAMSIPMVLNLGLSGQPMVGPDIGGFSENATPELFARWMGIGALLPFARGHSEKDTKDHEPWSFGAACEATCRRALERRMRLLPYLYGVARESAMTGRPIARPVFMADSTDASLRGIEDAFLLGGDLLVRANVSEPSANGQGSMPEHGRPVPVLASWRDLRLESEDDEVLPRLAIRPGAIVPIAPIMQHTGEHPVKPLTLLVNLDARHEARGSYYEDDGETLDFRQGQYRLTTFEAAGDERGGVVVRIESVEGTWPPHAHLIQVDCVNPGTRSVRVETIDVSGQRPRAS
ncbi:MAG: DUF5110 domain-containing protein [Phycisphaeraceae bacterium]|nr:DUF5110 domain-containing protein [Phycisphaeraceae bacterium]